MDKTKLDKKDSRWIYIENPLTKEEYVFLFDFIKDDWFVEAHKKFIEDQITLNTIAISTLHRYHYTLEHFYNFCYETDLKLKDFSDLTYQDVQKFIFNLKQKDLSNSTRTLTISALKKIIYHGQDFAYEGFPLSEVFDGREYQALKGVDAYTTEFISDDVMQQIENVIKNEENILFKYLLKIIIDTGLRISEALQIREKDLTLDFTNKPVLKVRSSKNISERFIPVSRRVYRSIKKLSKMTTQSQKKLGTEFIFVYEGQGKTHRALQPQLARKFLRRFVETHQIRDRNGNLYHLTFHAFRHTLGTKMINNGMSIFEIRDYLGHRSLRSSEYYSKVKDKKVQEEYASVDFIGLITEDIEKELKIEEEREKRQTLNSASLPDGYCGMPINNEGETCVKFNVCLLCPKFVTTPEFLSVHKDHLSRIRKDKENYMSSEHIGTEEHLDRVETSLVKVIEELEEIKDGSIKFDRF